MVSQQASISVAIVGAGFSGLSLAIALRNAEIVPTLFESRSGKSSCVVGDLFLPNGRESLQYLGMSDAWENLSKQTQRLNYVPQEDLQRNMREAVSDCIRYGERVIDVELDQTSGNLYCIVGTDCDACTHVGPFDIVVGADGVLSSFRKGQAGQASGGRIAIIGDARWVQDRFDLGTRRIRRGADIAIRDGIELAQILSKRASLGRFCAKKKRHEILARRGNIAIVIFALVLGRSFPFKGHKPNLAAAVFLASLIHIGGRIRIRLPNISQIPVTLQTLCACWGGLALGSTVGAQGAGLYALIWTVYHLYMDQDIKSWGYIVGLMSCAIVSGGLYGEGVHAVLATVAGQCCTLLTGALWLIVVSDDATPKPIDVVKGGVLPFLPGLVLKSVAAWRLLLMHTSSET
eukprot:CAMPEP_0178516094 /NCGR_PEP_ID=MMETSP0696-20121128/24921_1 /TAXON_ID=265572 /ORGANISM="Extubocellulus spinifer, Strain CCMP396" /LENGTH=403 /DNA_ID=CAMNT_0020146329 /DNA_START=107 /DNA_END=1314 /DNA_ORIENTATION=+